MDSAIFRQIPKMDRLLEGEAMRAAAEDLPRAEAERVLHDAGYGEVLAKPL